MIDRTVFKLRIRQVGTVCDFELSWGKGKIISVELNYPLSLTRSYEQWQSAYLNYYKRLRGRKVVSSKNYRLMRGRKVISGKGASPMDWRQELVKAEAQLVAEFKGWLLSPELVSIRREIAQATHKHERHWVEIFLTCTPLELARLPWEIWEIGTDLGASKRIRIARSPANILDETVHPVHRKARILAILGDDTGLNFEQDKVALQSLHHVAEIKIIGWKNNEQNFDFNINHIKTEFFEAHLLKNEIIRAITDQQGWDILFFAGHSNETALTGGELGIAPHTSISITEIEDSLKQAKIRGLQFAIFNSCSGINIAESLINLGLSQVAVMREPIHNQVAQEFLMQFLKSLANYKDVHEALVEACQFLNTEEKRLSYPSAYLVPSLFRHPDAELFCIQPFGIFDALKRWFPTRKEAKWLAFMMFISLLPPVQSLLLEPRIWLQAVYRQITWQVPAKGNSPIQVIQIDEASLQANTYPSEQVYPIDYSYLAALLARLTQLDAQIIGIDYILDDKKQVNNRLKLKKSIENAVNQKTWFVFASGEGQYTRRGGVSRDIASLNWSLEGDISSFNWYMELLPANVDHNHIYPFAYLLALAYHLNQESPAGMPAPSLQNQTEFQNSLVNYLEQRKFNHPSLNFIQQLRLHPLAEFSQNFLQLWFYPILDFSIPPNAAYQRISACKLLETCQGKGTVPKSFKDQIVLIIPGGYKGAGLEGKNEDNYAIPLAIGFWRGWQEERFAGGEAHAYMLHHFLTKRLVIPIPDSWILLLAALFGKWTTLVLQDRPQERQQQLWKLRGSTAIYLIASLQLYISVGILLPWFLPTILFWKYIKATHQEKTS